MKKYILLVSALLISSLASADVRFIPVKRYAEKEGLPPQLELTFDVACYETFLEVIRKDIRNPSTGKVTIAVGGLVTSLPLPCVGFSEQTVSGGNTYSGVSFEIVPISK